MQSVKAHHFLWKSSNLNERPRQPRASIRIAMRTTTEKNSTRNLRIMTLLVQEIVQICSKIVSVIAIMNQS